MLLGNSDAMQTIHTAIDQLSNNSKIPVLITGETGVGKGLVAQAIHFGGARASKPYVSVNCGATPLALWESIFLAMFKVPSPEQMQIIKAILKQPMAERYFSTKLGKCLSKAKSNSFRFWTIMSSRRSVQRWAKPRIAG